MTALAIIGIIIVVLLLIRLILPYSVLWWCNRKLSTLDGFRGSAESATINVFHGRVSVHKIRLQHYDKITGDEQPFFEASSIELAFHARDLFVKILKGTLTIVDGKLLLEKKSASKDEVDNKKKSHFRLSRFLEQFMDFRINVLMVNGMLRYDNRDLHKPLDVELKNVQVRITNLTNISSQGTEFPTKMLAHAQVYEGTLAFNIETFLLKEELTFDMNAKIQNVNLVLLNSFLRSHAGIDVNSGTFEMFVEVAARDGGFKGFIKPVIRNLDVIGGQDKNDKLLTRLWEGLVAGVYQLLKNKSQDQVATKIFIEGKWDNPHINIASAVIEVLKNAFVHAIRPSFDDVINLNPVKKSISGTRKFVRNFLGKRRSTEKSSELKQIGN